MVAPAESHVPSANPALDLGALRRQGAVAGILGAALLAAWFLYRDVLRGKPLFTPTVLATALLQGGAGLQAPETLAPSIGLTLLFTVLHTLVFVAIGVGAAELLYRVAHVRSRALLALLLFGALCLSFFAVALNVSAVGPQAVVVRDALIGNGIAALGMTAYLARNLPEHPAR
jgi:ABC-type sugar transport system permease subunit